MSDLLEKITRLIKAAYHCQMDIETAANAIIELVKPKLEWRGSSLFVENLYVGAVISQRPHSDKYRAWAMTDEDGESVGQYDTIEDAKEVVERAVREALEQAGE